MADYTLSEGAEQALEGIFVYTYDNYGAAQADAYHEAFHRTFGLRADFPFMGSSADELKPGLRRFPQGKHLVFYTPTGEKSVLIERVLHGRQNIRRHLFDD